MELLHLIQCSFNRNVNAAQPLVGADRANLGVFRLLHALSVGAVAKALSRIRPAAQPTRYVELLVGCL